MKVHPFADVFPLLRGEPYSSLCLDIETHGLREPLIITSDDTLVDGRNRLAACQDVGVEPRYERLPEGTTEVEILDLIMSKNLHRRHLDTTDRAILGVEYMKRFAEATGGSGARSDLCSSDHRSEDGRRPTSRERAAEVVGVSGATIDRAARVIREEPELAEKMVTKELTVSQADTQRRARAEGKREGVKPEPKHGGSVRPTTKQVVAVLSALSGIVHSTEIIDPSAYTPEDIKEFSEHVTALNVYRRKLTNNKEETEA